MTLIRSVSYHQDELLEWIIRLYIPQGAFEADATYSRDGFYRSGVIPRPRLCFDVQPQCEGVIQADCRRLPIAADSLESLVLDLPFLAAKGPSLAGNEGNIINRRFGVCPSETALAELYRDALREAYRVLKSGGVLVFKCQDKVSSGKQYMTHCDVREWAEDAGFAVEDLLILLARTRLVAKWQRNQKHARKFHSYFWVFRKPDTRRRSNRNEQVLELGQG